MSQPQALCRRCRTLYVPGEPDPCLGLLPGVVEACCGHGVTGKAYVMFEDGTLLRGFRRVEHHQLKANPGSPDGMRPE